LKKKFLMLSLVVSLVLYFAGVASVSAENIEWSSKKLINVKSSPLDVSPSKDGRWIFILSPGEVLVYSASKSKVINSIPVDKGFDRLAYSAKDNTLILSSRTGKAVKIIQLAVIHDIDVSGLPFLGERNAPVTIAVFGDYQ